MKLTPHLISTSPSYLNPVKDRVIVLRGLKADVIENLGVTNDLYETIDLTDNEIEVLGNFPLLPRLKTVLIAKNNITEIEDDLYKKLPNLTYLNLAANGLNDLIQTLKSLQNFTNLHTLILTENPITRNQNYRAYIIYKLPFLKVLDFAKIKDKERSLAVEMFSEDELGLLKNISAVVPKDKTLSTILSKLSDEDREALKVKLLNATSLDEIKMIENALKNGIV